VPSPCDKAGKYDSIQNNQHLLGVYTWYPDTSNTLQNVTKHTGLTTETSYPRLQTASKTQWQSINYTN
jgi:hypothetical protein